MRGLSINALWYMLDSCLSRFCGLCSDSVHGTLALFLSKFSGPQCGNVGEVALREERGK